MSLLWDARHKWIKSTKPEQDIESEADEQHILLTKKEL